MDEGAFGEGAFDDAFDDAFDEDAFDDAFDDANFDDAAFARGAPAGRGAGVGSDGFFFELMRAW